jgi:hypothetical protein
MWGPPHLAASQSPWGISPCDSDVANGGDNILAGNAAYEDFLLDTDDKEELHVADGEGDDGVDADDEGVEADDDGIESDNSDSESDTPAGDQKDPELEYELVSTELGDCGCVTGGSRIKRRSVPTCTSTTKNMMFLSTNIFQ